MVCLTGVPGGLAGGRLTIVVWESNLLVAGAYGIGGGMMVKTAFATVATGVAAVMVVVPGSASASFLFVPR